MTNRLLLSLVLLAAWSDGAAPVPDAAAARIFRDAAAGTLVIDLAPMDLPAHTPHHMIAQPPVATLEIPETGFIYGFRVQVVDSAGHALPDELIHHFNLIDPDHRELFLPISRRLLAAGHETGAIRLPRLLFGLPLRRGEHVVASAMVEKGRSTRSYAGSPVVPGTIVGLGGHMHDFGRLIEFVDATTGEVIYHAAPVADSGGHIESVPVAFLYGWTRLGVHVVPEHRYRVTVSYDNPTGQPIPDGGMGVVGGLFVPDRGVTWPAADPHDTLYHEDYLHYMRLVGGHEMNMAGTAMPMKMAGHEHAAHGHR